MNSLQDASFQDLNAILQCLEHYDKSGAPHAAEWREAVFAELRRRFAQFEENAKIKEAARAARDAASSGG
jgi:hypothetical protein